jgi:hypothetical protein
MSAQKSNQSFPQSARVFWALLLMWVLAAEAQNASKPPTGVIWKPVAPHQILAVGRVAWLEASASAPGSLAMTWPGTALRAAFEGDSLQVIWEDGGNAFRLIVDGQDRGRIEAQGAQGGLRTQVWTGFGPGPHLLEWIKVTESLGSVARVHAFGVPSSGRWLAAPRLKERQIEFIGDSWTAAMGNQSMVRECDWLQSQKLTDMSRGFALRTAKALGADVRVVAVSGQGMNRNWNGNDPTVNLRLLYPRILQNAPEAPSLQVRLGTQDLWNPQVYVIGLGTNDFSTEIQAGEKWTDSSLARAYVDSALAFGARLRQKSPQAWIVWTGHYLWPKDVLRPLIVELHQRFKAQGDAKVRFVLHEDLQLRGCLWHPDSLDHKRMAERLRDSLVHWTSWTVLDSI